MADDAAARLFRGGVPDAYEHLMVPLVFQPYADDLVARALANNPARVLELAAGTGVVTRGLAAALPPESTLVATDLNDGMLAVAEARGAPRPAGAPAVVWRPAEAQALPFERSPSTSSSASSESSSSRTGLPKRIAGCWGHTPACRARTARTRDPRPD